MCIAYVSACLLPVLHCLCTACVLHVYCKSTICVPYACSALSIRLLHIYHCCVLHVLVHVYCMSTTFVLLVYNMYDMCTVNKAFMYYVCNMYCTAHVPWSAWACQQCMRHEMDITVGILTHIPVTWVHGHPHRTTQALQGVQRWRLLRTVSTTAYANCDDLLNAQKSSIKFIHAMRHTHTFKGKKFDTTRELVNARDWYTSGVDSIM